MKFKLSMAEDLCTAYNYAHTRFDDLDLDSRSRSFGRGNSSGLNYLDK